MHGRCRMAVESLQCRDVTPRVFTDQADVACQRRGGEDGAGRGRMRRMKMGWRA